MKIIIEIFKDGDAVAKYESSVLDADILAVLMRELAELNYDDALSTEVKFHAIRNV